MLLPLISFARDCQYRLPEPQLPPEIGNNISNMHATDLFSRPFGDCLRDEHADLNGLSNDLSMLPSSIMNVIVHRNKLNIRIVLRLIGKYGMFEDTASLSKRRRLVSRSTQKRYHSMLPMKKM